MRIKMKEDRNGVRENIKRIQKRARRTTFIIGMLGLFISVLFNWNFSLIFSGVKYKAEVVSIQKEAGKCYQIDVDFTRMNGELVQKKITDCTGESFLFWIEEGDVLQLWESKYKPYKHYVPFANFAVRIAIAFFFVFIPFVFAAFGRYSINTLNN